MFGYRNQWGYRRKRGKVIVYDSFDRPDSNSSLGIADAGQTWQALNGVWGIQGNQAALIATGSREVAVIDTGVSDCIVSVVLSVNEQTASRLIVRAQGFRDHIAIGYISSQYRVYRVVNGSTTQLAGKSMTRNNGDILTARLQGDSVKVYVNDELIASVTESTFQNETRHGIGSFVSTVPRFDNFKVEKL